jgi:two-component system, cell cycle sensor histidine kinase and response regulator CckA
VSEGQRLESLRRLGLEDGAGDPALDDPALDDLVDLFRTLLGADAAALTIVGATHAWPMASAGAPASVELPRSRSPADLALGDPAGLRWVEDVSVHTPLDTHPWRCADRGLTTIAAATVGAPDGRPVGALELGWSRRTPADARATALLRRAADQLGERLELRAEAVEYRRFVELAPDPMVVLDLEGAVELCNSAFVELLAAPTVEALRGRAFLDLVVSDHRDRGAAELAEVLVGRRRTNTIDLTLRRSDGGSLPTAISAGHLHGPRHSLQLVVRDLTERVRAEGERARLTEQLAEAHRFETVGQLAGGLAHDLNNLLAILVSNLQFADETLADLRSGGDVAAGVSSMAEDLAQLRAVADRVDVLTRKLLQFASRSDAPAGPAHVGPVVTGLRELLERTLGADVALRVEVAEGVPAVRLDPGELEQAVTNLVLNGRDAMPDGGELVVRVRPDVRGGGEDGAVRAVAVVEVVDEGVGMTDAVLARAFEPLYTTKPADRGTGLGLSSVQAFVRRIGGTVQVASEPGAGTRVMLTLPAAGVGTTATPDADASETAAPLVLLADPADRSRRVIAAMFEQAGYRVVEVADAAAAQGWLETGQVAAFACELALAGGTGSAVVAAARAAHPDLPVMLLTSNPDVRDEIDGVPVVVKPFSSDRLLATIAVARTSAAGTQRR